MNHDGTSISISPAVQDYLRAIYQLTGDVAPDSQASDNRATTSQLAERLDVRPASVTAMLQRMASAAPALVEYHKSHGARLTADGERAALSVVRCHRLLELFLHEKLGYGWDEVHDEADRLEHVLSEEMTSRIDRTLGYPTHDPHGHAIPAADLSLNKSEGVPLGDLAEGEPGVVEFVRDENADMLRDLDTVGLRPGAKVAIVRREPDQELLWLDLGGDTIPLSELVAGQVFVTRPAPRIPQNTSKSSIRES